MVESRFMLMSERSEVVDKPRGADDGIYLLCRILEGRELVLPQARDLAVERDVYLVGACEQWRRSCGNCWSAILIKRKSGYTHILVQSTGLIAPSLQRRVHVLVDEGIGA